MVEVGGDLLEPFPWPWPELGEVSDHPKAHAGRRQASQWGIPDEVVSGKTWKNFPD